MLERLRLPAAVGPREAGRAERPQVEPRAVADGDLALFQGRAFDQDRRRVELGQLALAHAAALGQVQRERLAALGRLEQRHVDPLAVGFGLRRPAADVVARDLLDQVIGRSVEA